MHRNVTVGVRRAVALVSALALVAAPLHAYPFIGKSHVSVANLALSELDPTYGYAWMLGLGPVALQNEEAMAAIRDWPAYFRAGAVGPDSFPDLIGGQVWAHVNNGCGDGVHCTTDSSMPLEGRKVGEWRSIDYGMYQLWRARQVPDGVGRQQALAFAYGYLAHQMSDAFAHAWMNEWTRDYFSLFEGSGIFGPVTEEIQHVAIERYVDKHLLAGTEDLTLATPSDFLNDIYLQPIGTRPGENALVPSDVVGAFAGVYYEQLIRVRDLMTLLKDHENWASAVGTAAAPLIAAMLQHQDQLHDIAGLGTDLFNPIADVEDYFRRREVVLNALLNEWVTLSGCIAQNLVSGGALPPGEPLLQDACAAIDFEANPDVENLFEGDLNDAAHYGADEQGYDHGSLGNNLKRMGLFVKTIAEVAVRFSITEDVATVRRLLSMLTFCDNQLLQWGSCQQACDHANQTCTTLVTRAACTSCPTRDGHYNCGSVHWYGPDERFYICLHEPHCFGCVTDWLEEVTDYACLATRDATMPLCNLCASENAVCKTVETTRALVTAVPDALELALQPLLDRVREEVAYMLVEWYAGRYVADFVAAAKEVERSWHRATPAWIVNIAFLREDLRADPEHLNRIITSVLGISGSVVDNSLELADAVQHTLGLTATQARAVLAAFGIGSSDSERDSIWSGLVTLLYEIARDPGDTLDLLGRFASETYAWLELVTIPSSGVDDATAARRLAKFLALVAEIQMLSQIRGPTVLKLRAELGLDHGADDFTGGAIEPHQIHVVHNSVEAVKLGFLGKEGIDALLARAGDAELAPGTRSAICNAAPHIACDVIQSLDDPSTIRFDAFAPGVGDIEYEPRLSLARWFTNTYQWSNGTAWQDPARCKFTKTDFPLAYTPERIIALYDKVFQYPPDCRPTTDLRVVAQHPRAIDLAWTDRASEETGFVLERKTGLFGTYVVAADVPENATSWSDTGLEPSTTYYYRLKATMVSGDLPYSNEVLGSTLATPPTIQAVYSDVLGVPYCPIAAQPSAGCDSGSFLLYGKSALETNYSNTLNMACIDGASADNHQYSESIDRISIRTVDGTELGNGKRVRADVTVFPGYDDAGNPCSECDRLDVYYMPNHVPGANDWQYVGTVTPSASGTQVLSIEFTMGIGARHAVRTNFRNISEFYYGADTRNPSPCSPGGLTDHDDLVFSVASNPTPVCSRDPMSDPLNCGGCGIVCSAGANASSACTNGQCVYACASHWFNCDGDWNDGCETYLDQSCGTSTCGQIGMECFGDEECCSEYCVGADPVIGQPGTCDY